MHIFLLALFPFATVLVAETAARSFGPMAGAVAAFLFAVVLAADGTRLLTFYNAAAISFFGALFVALAAALPPSRCGGGERGD